MTKKKERGGILSKKPLGPSERTWCNDHWGTDGPILCEICGTSHPERLGESYTMSRFLDRQVVEECCGKLLDIIYRESDEEFALAFLREFAENPIDSRFYIFRKALKEALQKANQEATEVVTQTQELLELSASLSAK